VFYAERFADLAAHYARAGIVLTDPLALAENAARGASDMRSRKKPRCRGARHGRASAHPIHDEGRRDEGAAAQQEAIQLRTDFNPLALFAPWCAPMGMARPVCPSAARQPDSLPVMAVAVEGGSRFGTAESNLTARLPLMVRPSAPPPHFGDRFELPVVIQNQTGRPLSRGRAARRQYRTDRQPGLPGDRARP
jgi:hypothetical protein